MTSGGVGDEGARGVIGELSGREYHDAVVQQPAMLNHRAEKKKTGAKRRCR